MGETQGTGLPNKQQLQLAHDRGVQRCAEEETHMKDQIETVARIVAWLRKPLTLIRGISMVQNERLADAIEAGDWK